jgi:hypothetical protein
MENGPRTRAGTVYPVTNDPGLVESRLKVGPSAEHEKSHKIIQTLTAILWRALIIIPGIRTPLPFFAHSSGVYAFTLNPSREPIPRKTFHATGEPAGVKTTGLNRARMSTMDFAR